MSTILACASCIASAFGDRTFNWPYLSLIIMPFIVAVAIGGVLAYYAGVRPRAVLRALRRAIFGHFTARLGRRTASPRTAIHARLAASNAAQLVPPRKETT